MCSVSVSVVGRDVFCDVFCCRARVFQTRFSGYPLSMRFVLNVLYILFL